MTKKKSEITLTAIVELILVIVLFLIAFVACTTIKNGFSNNDEKYIASFKDFVNGINDMTNPRKVFTVEVKTRSAIGSAIIGFSKEGNAWKCVNCNPDRSFSKPHNQQCDNNACACLCLDGFKFKGILGQCEKPLICETLEDIRKTAINIKQITIISSNDDKFQPTDTYWENGFLFANGVTLFDNDINDANGMKNFMGNQMEIFVDKDNNVISVCNAEMRQRNKNAFNDDKCTTPP